MVSPAEFMQAAPRALDGSSEWGSRYGHELRGVITRHASQAPRSLQVRLGPSELGNPCDRAVIGRMAGVKRTNHVFDPWASVQGTAVHRWLAEAFDAENRRENLLRWITEVPVAPSPEVSGTSDLYDALLHTVADWKILGPSSLQKIKSGGPSPRYRIQLMLYAAGFRAVGLPVDRVALVALPRGSSSLDGMFVWEASYTAEDELVVAQVLERTKIRAQLAGEVAAGRMNIMQIPAKPDDSECYFCPFYRPQSAYDGGSGCPGTLTPKLTELFPGQPVAVP